ncbi:MAG: DUF2148 domain-containing protein [Bacillota bacterium]
MRIDGKEAARDAVLEVAKLAAAAAYRAPQLTGVLKIETEIITGEDQDPIIEFAGALAPISPVMNFDYQTMKYFRDNNSSLVCLLIGAKLDRSELNWDCGGCGFQSCADFNKWAMDNGGMGALWGGPSCLWKLMDWSAACDYACAAAGQYRMDARAMGTIGAACAGVGYMPECTARVAVLIGPPGDFVYFSRRQNRDAFPHEQHRLNLLRTSPTNWMSFPGSTRPSLKTKDDWWNDMDYIRWEPLSEAEKQFASETLLKLQEVSAKHIPNVTGWYEKKK